MYYKESQKILAEVKKAKRIVTFCHESPDLDSVLSCVALATVLKRLGKKVDVFSVDKLSVKVDEYGKNSIITVKDPHKIKFDSYDILFALDVNEIRRLGIDENIQIPCTIIQIDHHVGATIGDISISEPKAGSTCSILFHVFKDWNIALTRSDVQTLMKGLLSDTDAFRFSGSLYVFETIREMIEKGGNYEKALFDVVQQDTVQKYQFIADGIKHITVDRKNRFAYTILRYSDYKKYLRYGVSSRDLSDGYLRNIINTNFGVVIMENSKGEAKVSIRTRRPKYYVIDLVRRLGGGGHKTGGGALIAKSTFDKSVKKILKECRQFARERSAV